MGTFTISHYQTSTAPPLIPAPPAENRPYSLLKERFAVAWQAGRIHVPPYITDWSRTTPEIKAALREMFAHAIAQPALLSKVFAVSSLDLQIHAADDTPQDRAVADFHTYAFERCDGGS